jgi:pimeloyl-ACP methyl ester carboxylesterase
MKMDVFIIDYRGYGQSEGAPGEESTYLDAEASWEYLVSASGIPPERIIIFGRSLGSAVAAELALRHGDAAGLVMESGFTSVADVGKELFPYLPVGLIVRHKYATIEKVDRIGMPKLIVHSPQDDIIPYSHGVALYRRAAEPKAFLKISGGHNSGFMISGKHYVEGLSRFISECLGRGDAE